MSVRNAKEKGLLYRKCKEKRELRVNETFVVAEWRQEGGSGQGSTGTRNSTWRGEEETSERLVRMCCSIPAYARMVPTHELREHAIQLPRFFFFGTPTQVSAAMAILANAMVGHGGVRELYNLTRAEYFIPAYHFVYIPYWQWPDTGGTSVRNISLCTLPTLSP